MMIVRINAMYRNVTNKEALLLFDNIPSNFGEVLVKISKKNILENISEQFEPR